MTREGKGVRERVGTEMKSRNKGRSRTVKRV